MLLLIYFVFPPLFGEGYDSVKLLANSSLTIIPEKNRLFQLLGNNWGMISFSALIVLFKPVAAGITNGSGGNGGNFPPSLFTGTWLGFWHISFSR